MAKVIHLAEIIKYGSPSEDQTYYPVVTISNEARWLSKYPKPEPLNDLFKSAIFMRLVCTKLERVSRYAQCGYTNTNLQLKTTNHSWRRRHCSHQLNTSKKIRQTLLELPKFRTEEKIGKTNKLNI